MGMVIQCGVDDVGAGATGMVIQCGVGDVWEGAKSMVIQCGVDDLHDRMTPNHRYGC